MNRYDFYIALESGLSALPEQERQATIDYYAEMIDDRIEDGLGEEEAVAAVGDVNEIIRQVLMDTPLPKLVKEKVKSHRALRAWEIVLLVLGSPVWIPLLGAAAIIVAAVIIVFWALVLSLFAVTLAVAVGAVAGIGGAIVLIIRTGINAAVGVLGAAFVAAGIAILLFFGFKAAFKGAVWLCRKCLAGIKSCFIGKERTK